LINSDYTFEEQIEMTDTTDRRHHVESMLMRESLLDKEVMASTESPVVRMLPDVHVVKIGRKCTKGS
jgi:molybdenum storage protein